MKKFGIAIAALFALSALAVVSTRLATDDGGFAVNHSQGVAVFPYSKLKTASSAKTIPLYTTAAAWPTRFVVETVAYDAGCQLHTLTETPYTGTPSGLSAGLPTYCVVDLPRVSIDAGVVTIYKSTDGGYGLSLCPANTAMPAGSDNALPAFCYRQAGLNP